MRKISYEGGRKELESITAPSASEEISDVDMDEDAVLSAAAAAAEAEDGAAVGPEDAAGQQQEEEDMEVRMNSVTIQLGGDPEQQAGAALPPALPKGAGEPLEVRPQALALLQQQEEVVAGSRQRGQEEGRRLLQIRSVLTRKQIWS